jgi:hypothetical protein
MRGLKAKLLALGAVSASLAISSNAHAALTLTAQAVADGFSLSQFYSDPAATYSMLGMTNTSDGRVVGAGYGRGVYATFNDVDGQTFASATTAPATRGTPTSVATVNGNTYVNALGGGYFQLNTTTLTTTALSLDLNFGAGYGLWADQSTGHLLASGLSNGIFDIDPATGHVRTVTSGIFFDGVSVSPDGTVVYGADTGAQHVRGYNILTGLQVLDVAVGGTGPDGTGVISGSAFNGWIVVNNNNGTVGIIDPTTSTERIIATGGTRGDLVGPDGNNGSLFLSQNEGVFRLSIAGGTIGGGPAIPEPSTWAMMLLGFGGLGGLLRRRRAQPALTTA